MSARLADRVAHEVQAFPKNTAMVVADDVWRLFWQADEEWRPMDFPKLLGPVRPPFPAMWVEGICPQQVYVPGRIEGYEAGWAEQPYKRAGILVREVDVPEEWARATPTEPGMNVPTPVALEALFAGLDRAVLCNAMIEGVHGNLVGFVAVFAYGDDGCILLDRDDFEDWHGDHFIPWRLMTSTEHHSAEGVRAIGHSVLTPLLLALSFMHCKNVSLEERRVPLMLQRKHAKRGHPLAVTRWSHLRIPGMSGGVTGARAAAGAPLPFHAVRGHFKTYTEEAPLLGKHTGTFWWGWHQRGNETYGRREHVYDVQTGEHE